MIRRFVASAVTSGAVIALALGFSSAIALTPAPAAASTAGTAASATPDFQVTVDPISQSRKRGTGAPYFVTITSVNGFNGSVTLSLSGNIPPNGVVSIGDPSGFGPLNSGGVDIQIQKHTFTIGTFAMTIHAVSGTLEHDVDITLTIR
jgi:hypothetical protein